MTERAVAARAIWSLKSFVARIPGVYRAYKWITTRLGEGRIYSISAGPMRGMRWQRRNTLPYWYHKGMYEPHVSELILGQLREGDIFWDIGANAGYHTILAARAVGPRGKVVAVEADPETAEILRTQIALNNLQNCTIVVAAVAATVGSATFTRKPNNLQSALAEVDTGGTPITVPTVTLDAMVHDFGQPAVLKMDIEGAEVLALPGGTTLFRDAPRPRLLLSVHGPQAVEFCKSFLEHRDYRFAEQVGFEQMWLAIPKEQP